MMPSIRFVLLCFVLVLLHGNNASAAQPSSTTNNNVNGVASFILRGLGYTQESVSSTIDPASIRTAVDDKVASQLPSRYYANATASSNTTSTVSNLNNTTVSTSARSPTTSKTSSTTPTATYIHTTSSSVLVNATISSAQQSNATTPSTQQSSYTTFTSLCTENGTLVTHTHSAPITANSPTTSSASESYQLTNSSSSNSVQISVSAAPNATTSQISIGGIYTSNNDTTSTLVSGPTATYANSSVSGYLNGTNTTVSPTASTTATGPQHTLTAAAPWTVPSNGSGYAYASKCNAEWSSYWASSQDVNTPSYQDYKTTYIITNYSAPLTTLCAGNTQIDGPLVSTGTMELPWTLQSTMYSATITMPPEPSCTIPSAQCSAVGVLPGQTFDLPKGCSAKASPCGPCTIQGSNIQLLYFPLPSAANVTKDVCAGSPSGANNACPYGSWVTSTTTSTQTFTGETVTGSSTATDGYGTTTYTATNLLEQSTLMTATYTETMSECVYTSAGLGGYNNASSIVSNGATFYENMMYLSFKSVWAVNSCGSTIGTPRTGSLVGMPSSEVYSVCTHQGGSAAYPYNVQDLSGYLPQSAWNCQPYCNMVWNDLASGSGAPSEALPGDSAEDLDNFIQHASPGNFYVNDEQVFVTKGGYCAQFPSQEWYKPYVAVPPEVRNLDPEWQSCVLAFEGWYDPPTVISQATSVAGPSTPTAVYTTAQPGSTQSSALPSSTLAPTTTKSTAATTSAASAPSAVPYSSSASPASTLEESTPASSQSTSPETPTAYSEGTSISSAASASTESTESVEQTSSQGASPSAYSSTSGSGAATTEAISDIISAIQPATSTSSEPVDTTTSADSSVAPSATPGSSAEAQSSQTSSASLATSSSAQTAASEVISVLTAAQTSSPQATTAAADPATSESNDAGTTPASYAPSSAQTSQVVPSPLQTTIAAGDTSVTVSQVSSGGAAIVDGSTVSQGSQATINGQTVSVGQSGVQIGTTTIPADPTVSTADPADASEDPGTVGATAVVTANGQTLTAVKYSGSTVLAPGSSTTTLAPDDPATISGQQVSVASGGSGLVVNGGSTATLSSQAPSSASPQIVTIGSSAYTVAQTSDTQGSSAIVVAAGGSTATLAAGHTTTLGGQTVVAPSSGGAVLGSGSYTATVQPVSTSSANAGGSDPGSTVLSIGSSPLTLVQAGSSVIFAGASSTITLAQGASTTFAGQTVVAAPSNGGAVVGGSTVILSSPVATGYSAVVTGSSGQQVTVARQGSSVLFAAGSSTVTLAHGSSTTFAGQTVAAGSSAGAVIVGSSTISLGQTTPVPTQAIMTASNGQQVTAVQQGSSAVFAVGASSITVAQGSTTTFAGQTIAAVSGATGITVDGSTVSLTPPTLATPGAVFTGSAGQSITVLQQGQSYIVQDGASTISLTAGVGTAFDGAVVSVPTSASGGAPSHAVVNGQTVALSEVSIPTAASAGAVLTGANNKPVTVLQQGSSYVIQDGSSTLALPTGSAASFDGMTISVPSAGGAPVVNGQAVTLSSLQTTLPEVATEAIFTDSVSQLATVVQAGSSYLVQDGSSTATLGAGSTTTFDGHTIAVPTSGGAAVVDGSALPLSAVTRSGTAAGESSPAMTGHNAPAGSGAPSAGPQSTTALSAGSRRSSSASLLVFGGVILSVAISFGM